MKAVAIILALLAHLSPEALAQAESPSTIPAEIPLFPLPETSLFPGVSRPFLIFEPRYREMIADALKGDKIIGMVRLRPGFEKDYEGRPPIYDVGCAGTIEKYCGYLNWLLMPIASMPMVVFFWLMMIGIAGATMLVA